MEKPRIVIHPPKKATTIHGLPLVATANMIIHHNRINGIKVVDCPSRGLLVLAPSSVKISMECKEMIMEVVKQQELGPERLDLRA